MNFKAKKIITAVVAFLLLAVVGYVSTQLSVLNPYNGAFESLNSNNITSGTIIIPQIYGNVTVDIDSSGLAHIYANNNTDLFFAQGYYSASQRLFQMELQSALAAGNLTSLVGSTGLASDITMRLIGLNRNAETLLNYLKTNYPTCYGYLQDYANGVNAFINSSQSKYILGFKLLGVKPYLWSVFDSLVWQQYMSWSLATGACSVLQSDMFEIKLGYTNYSQIWPYYPYYTENITMVPGSGTVNGYNLTDQGINVSYFWNQDWFSSWATGVSGKILNDSYNLILSAYNNISDPYALPGSHDWSSPVGSNSWIITSNYSLCNENMLANDPHLPLLAPSLWIPFQLVDNQMNVTGWGLAGVPGVLIGHTSNTSFGLTTPEGNSANDYLETLQNNTYLYNGNFVNMTECSYTQDGNHYVVYCTNNGPLIARNNRYGISLNWDSRYPSLDLLAEIKLDMASNYSEMMNALKFWGPAPPQNFALVSLHHAGYITAGGYPLINETLPDGKNVKVVGSVSLLNGSSSKYEPDGYVPFKYLPQQVNPKRGYMFAPNQPTVSKNYPFPFVGSYWASGGRAESIYHFIQSHNKMNLTDMEELQSNVTDYWASQYLPLILKPLENLTNINYTESYALNLLKNWNFSYYQDMKNPTVYLYLTAAIYNISFNRIYEKSGLLNIVPNPYTNTAIYLAKNYPNSPWYNGNFSSTVIQAFKMAISFMDSKIGNVSNWNWGNAHLLEIESLTQLPQLSIGPIPIWGGRHTVSVGYTPRVLQYPLPYVQIGSSLREISIPEKKVFLGVFPGGPSENVLSYWFKNQLDHWLNHQYYIMNDQKTVVVIKYEH
ncbi:penicillin acylase family protein [Caldiplasma sukawensis]